jgi:hypothetical protein
MAYCLVVYIFKINIISYLNVILKTLTKTKGSNAEDKKLKVFSLSLNS